MKYIVLSLILCCAIYIARCEEETRDDHPCYCGKIYMPLCASDGRTYNNKCEFECARKERQELKIVRDGSCA